MAIQDRLANYPVPESVWDEYHHDQEINDRGVALDMELVKQAIALDARSRSELTTAMKELTALENPNSVQQMKLWLADNGLETDTLGKKAVAEMLKTASPEMRRVLTLRQQLAKSSVKKYQAMETAVCADGRFLGESQSLRSSLGRPMKVRSPQIAKHESEDLRIGFSRPCESWGRACRRNTAAVSLCRYRSYFDSLEDLS